MNSVKLVLNPINLVSGHITMLMASLGVKKYKANISDLSGTFSKSNGSVIIVAYWDIISAWKCAHLC